jgi:choline dehydrogenase-like flavoprotein
VAAVGDRNREPVRIEGRTFVISAGAVNSAALLLRSTSPHHPRGLANSSGSIGRGLMLHNLSAIMAVGREPNPTVFQKTLGINDWYLKSPGDGRPLGNLQTLGKIRPNMLATAVRGVPRRVVAAVTARSWDWFATSEDLPDTDNRVTVAPDGRTRVAWSATNAAVHDELVRRARRMLRRAGFPVVLARRFGIENNSHQCGTVRFGTDPATAPLDSLCRSHDVPNLYVVDASFMPSSAAVNPGLTVVAQALRVAHLSGLASTASADLAAQPDGV